MKKIIIVVALLMINTIGVFGKGPISEINKERKTPLNYSKNAIKVAQAFANADSKYNQCATDGYNGFSDREILEGELGYKTSYFHSIHTNIPLRALINSRKIRKIFTDPKVTYIGIGNATTAKGKIFTVIILYGVK